MNESRGQLPDLEPVGTRAGELLSLKLEPAHFVHLPEHELAT